MGDRLGHVLKYLMKSKQGTDRGITWSSISEAASDDFIQDNIKNISVETITSIIEKAVTHAK